MSRPGYSADTPASELAPPHGASRTAPTPSSAADEVGAVRVHPDDQPMARDARRVIRTDDAEDDTPWDMLTGNERRASGMRPSFTHDEVVGWPRQSLAEVASVLGYPGSTQTRRSS